MKALSLAKFEDNIINEDAAIATPNLIAVSDGAGGGGVFAECWSRYLVEHLPVDPISDFQSFDNWIDSIWEPFYDLNEQKAKSIGGLFLNKFYNEGSFATLAVVWKNGQWLRYGDSVAFCYNKQTKKLQHSFSRLVDFNSAPYLINCKDPLNEKGFVAGFFTVSDNDIVFATSDTLAHYILMMYEVSQKEHFSEELCEALQVQTKNSNFIKTAMSLEQFDFERDVLQKLLNCNTKPFLKNHLKHLKKIGLIGHDDYSIAFQ